MRDRLAVLDEPGDDVLAEIAAGAGVAASRRSCSMRNSGRRRRCPCWRAHAGTAGDRGGIGGLLEEGPMRSSRRRASTPKPVASRGTSSSRRSRRRRVDVLVEHLLVVHLVDVVAGQDDDVLGRVALDDVDVLVHRIRGPRIPRSSETRWLAGRMSKLSLRSGAGSSSRAADGGSGCAPCTASPRAMRRMPELRALDSAKSTMRDLPPK